MSRAREIWDGYWSDEGEHGYWKEPAPEVLALIERCSPQDYPRALDLGCGLGRHAVTLAKAGFTVTATDSSETAIEHLNDWAKRLGLSIDTKACGFLDDELPAESFDLVLAYNAIYHGGREDMAAAISHVRDVLRPGGLLFFTHPTRSDGKYGFGEELAPHTYASSKSVTPGDVHYFADDDDLAEWMAGFRELSRHIDEGQWDNKGTAQFFSNAQLLWERKEL